MKKLMSLIAVLGLAMSSWAMTPDRTPAADKPQAQVMLLMVEKTFDYFGYRRSGAGYHTVQTIAQVAGVTVGAVVGGHLAGPVGVVVGAGAGAF